MFYTGDMNPSVDSVDDLPVDAAFVVGHVLDGLECADVDLRRGEASRAARMADVVALARRAAHVYVPDASVLDADEWAERAAVLDIALRLRVSEDQVRAEVFAVEQAREHLPGLWDMARDGFAPLRLVQRTVGALARIRAPHGAPDEVVAAARAAMRKVDEAATGWVLECSEETYLWRLGALIARLDPTPAERRRAKAVLERHVALEHVDDGMSWMHALLPTEQVLGINRSLTSQAKHLQKMPGETRTRDQLRADLLADRLTGTGTAAGRGGAVVRTEVFVTIPVRTLTDAGQATTDQPGTDQTSSDQAGTDQAASDQPSTDKAGSDEADDTTAMDITATAVLDASATVFSDVPQVIGHGPIDPVTAKQLLLDAGSFRRVLIDPIDSAIVDMDRRRRVATPAQRAWLALQHGTCARDGCERLAIDADIDHVHSWATGGRTDIAELRPLCPRDHAACHRTRMRYRSRPNRTVEVTTPTGHTIGRTTAHRTGQYRPLRRHTPTTHRRSDRIQSDERVNNHAFDCIGTGGLRHPAP